MDWNTVTTNVQPVTQTGNPATTVQQPFAVPQQPAVQPPAVASSFNNNFTFQMDADTHKILGAVPEMYRNFIINFGIKLAAEQDIYQNYLTNYFSISETGEPVSDRKSVV